MGVGRGGGMRGEWSKPVRGDPKRGGGEERRWPRGRMIAIEWRAEARREGVWRRSSGRCQAPGPELRHGPAAVEEQIAAHARTTDTDRRRPHQTRARRARRDRGEKRAGRRWPTVIHRDADRRTHLPRHGQHRRGPRGGGRLDKAIFTAGEGRSSADRRSRRWFVERENQKAAGPARRGERDDRLEEGERVARGRSKLAPGQARRPESAWRTRSTGAIRSLLL